MKIYTIFWSILFCSMFGCTLSAMQQQVAIPLLYMTHKANPVEGLVTIGTCELVGFLRVKIAQAWHQYFLNGAPLKRQPFEYITLKHNGRTLDDYTLLSQSFLDAVLRSKKPIEVFYNDAPHESDSDTDADSLRSLDDDSDSESD